MANATTANLIKYQAKIIGSQNQAEFRVREPELFNYLRKGTEFMIPSHKEIKHSAKRTTGEVNFMARAARSLGNGGETHDHAGTRSDTGIVVPSWTAYDDKFVNYLKQANGSVFGAEDMMMQELINLNNNFSEGLEDAAATHIFTNRTQVNKSLVDTTWDATDNVYKITEDFTNIQSTGYRVLQIIQTGMRIAKYSNINFTVACDSVMWMKLENLMAQGNANAQNTSFQFGRFQFIHSVEMDALAASLTVAITKGFAIVIPEGTTAVLDWMPPQNMGGYQSGIQAYSTLRHPSTGLDLAFHEYWERVDGTSVNSQPQDEKNEYQAFSYISFNESPLSTTNETVYYAFGLV